MEVRVERNPQLKLDWRRESLDENDLRNTGLCYVMLPAPNERESQAPFDKYLTGLGFLSKTDIHMQFEGNAYECFYNSLKVGMRAYGDWDGKVPFSEAFGRLLDVALPQMEPAERTRYLEMGEQFSRKEAPKLRVTLSEVGAIKILCDAYFIRTFRKRGEERAKKEDGPKKSSGSSSKA